MKNKFIKLTIIFAIPVLFLATVLLSTPLLSAQSQHPRFSIFETQATIQGSVTAVDTGEPISATVQLYSDDNPREICNPNYCTTDPLIEEVFLDCNSSPEACIEGFSFDIEPHFDYYLQAIPHEDSPYLPEYFDSILEDNDAYKINLAEGEVFDAANFTLSQGGAIKGIVTDSVTNQPLYDIRVALHYLGALDDDEGHSFINPPEVGSPVYTNSSGEFIFTDVLDGKYELSFNQSNHSGYLSSELKGEGSIQVTSNQTVTLSHTLDKQGTISGRVTSRDDGAPIPLIQVSASPIEGHYSLSKYAVTDANGYYTITHGLIFDSYLLEAFMHWSFNNEEKQYVSMFYDQVFDRNEATIVNVLPNENTSNINFSMYTKGEFKGTVSTEDNGPFENATVIVYQDDGKDTRSVGEFTVSSSEPNFHIFADPGEYFLKVDTAFQSDYLDAFYNGSNESDAERIQIDLEEIVDNIDIQLSIGGVISVTELIDADTSQPIESPRYTLHGDGIGSKNSRDGLFTGLETGQYYLRSYSDGYTSKFYDNGKTLAESKPIFVTAGETTYVSDSLEPTSEQPLAKLSGTIKYTGVESDYKPQARLTVNPLGEETYSSGDFFLEFDASQLPDGKATLSFSIAQSCGYHPPTRCLVPKFHTYGVSESNPSPTEIQIKNGDVIENIEIVIELSEWSTISGIVKDAETNEFINATIDLFQNSESYHPTESITLNCDLDPNPCEDGYLFKVAPGIYNVRVTAENYPETYFGNPKETSTLINVSSVGLQTEANFLIDPLSASLHGRLIDNQDEQPIPGVPLVAYNPFTIGNTLYSSTRSYEVTTDDLGKFEFNNLPPGQYRILVAYSGFEGEKSRHYIRGYLENDAATSEEERQFFTLTNNRTTMIESRLQLGESLKVNLVVNHLGTSVPITWTTPYAQLYTPEGTLVSANYDVNQNEGSVTLHGVKEGVYRLLTTSLLTQFYLQTDQLESAVPITITANTSQAITVPVNPKLYKIVPLTFSDTDTKKPLDAKIFGESYRLDLTCDDEPQFSSDMFDSSSVIDGNYFYPLINYTYDFHFNHKPDAENDYLPKIISTTDLMAFDPEAPNDFNIPLERGSLIQGKITSNLGKPLPEVTIKIYKISLVNNQPAYELASESKSDIYGIYRSRGLAAGDYAILFDTGNDPELNFVSQFYGNSLFSTDPQFANPTVVSLAATQEITVNQALERGGSITGFALDKVTKKSARYNQIELVRKTANGSELLKSFTIGTRSNGFFEFYGLQDGEYYIYSKPLSTYYLDSNQSTWYGNAEQVENATPIIISSGSTVGPIEILYSKENGAIHGEIVLNEFGFYKLFLDDQPQNKVGKYSNPTKTHTLIKVYDEDGALIRDQWVNFGGRPRYRKQFQIDGFRPGTYYLYFETYDMQVRGECNDIAYYGEWYGGGSTIDQATPIVIEENETIGNIVGTLSVDNPQPLLPDQTPLMHELTGRVVDQAGSPVEGVTVTAETGRHAVTSSTVTNANGEYTLSLPNGSYTVSFTKEGYDFSQTNLNITIDGSGQTVKEVVASTPAVPTPTPEPVTGNDSIIYLPSITR